VPDYVPEPSAEYRRIRLRLAYDGTRFCGWQVQKRERTVQQVIELALQKMHDRRVPITGAGRTDSGVHAAGQAAHFDTELLTVPPYKFAPALNSLLPSDVRILEAEEADRAFDARRSAKAREYRYYTASAERLSPFRSPYVLALRTLPDIRKLNGYARAVTGEHDFSAFAAAGDQSASRVRYIYSASWYPEGPMLVFRIVGNAFLWRMVRSLVGTMLELETRGEPEQAMVEILRSRERSDAGATAAPRGLFLHRVLYE
jgi:tRNA pseudouridine38-40 synthase